MRDTEVVRTGEQQRSRHLDWDACYNVRETGGYPTIDGHTTRWHALLRADNLCRLTPRGCASLAAHGVRTIIDLRTTREVALEPHPFGPEAVAARESGVAYVNLPLINSAGSTEAPIDGPDVVGQTYLMMVEQCRPQMAVVLSAIAHAAEGGVLVHCHAGKDRTGMVVAMLLSIAGVAPEIVAEDYALSDAHLEPLYADERAAAGDADRLQSLMAWHASPPEAMLGVLSYLERTYGGGEGYACAGGVTPEEIGRLRARLRD